MIQPPEPDVIRQMYAAYDAKEMSILAGLTTDDVTVRHGNGAFLEGKRSFIAEVNAFLGLVTGIRHEVLALWRDDHIVVAELDVHYLRLDGTEVTLPSCNVFRVQDGLISEYRIYMDNAPIFDRPFPAQSPTS
jgi:ketosteroid isomerase-like protein